MTLLDRERLVTRTGLRLEVRAAHGEDERALAAFFAKVTPEDMRFRFLSTLERPVMISFWPWSKSRRRMARA